MKETTNNFKLKLVNIENSLFDIILSIDSLIVHLSSFILKIVYRSPFIVLTFLWCYFPFSVKAQTFKSLLKEAEIAEKNKNSIEAAIDYERAWHLQPKKYEELLKAAELYQSSRDYLKAAQCYKTLSEQSAFTFTHWDCARELQQSGKYEDAIPEYLLALNNYDKKDKDLVAEQIETDIEGCTKGIRETETFIQQKINGHLAADTKIFSGVQNLASNIQSPFLFNDDILYFINRTQKDTTLKRAQWLTDDWSQPESVSNMTAIAGGNVESGCFSNNGNVFYFSRKSEIGLGTAYIGKKIKSKAPSLTYETQLYAVERVNDSWSSPILLNENVNAAGAVNTQPYTFEKDGYEWLFFSSNRQNGSGGMDIWFTRRPLNAPLSGFEKALNCGQIINTEGDEVTPFYDVEENTLYFSSDGRAVFGGLDVFKSKGRLQQWLTPENLGLPYNSPADDIYFRMNKSRTFSLVVSNRMFGLEKTNTLTDDLFTFILKSTDKDIFVEGRILDKTSGNLLKNERVTLYESLVSNQMKSSNENRQLNADGNLRLLSSVISKDGLFRFPVFSNKFYNLEIEKDSFNLKNLKFSTPTLKYNLTQVVYLDKTNFSGDDKIVVIKNSRNVPMEERVKRIPNSKDSINDIQRYGVQKTKVLNKNTKDLNTSKTETVPTGKVSDTKINYRVQILAYEELDWFVKKRLISVEDIGDFVTEKPVINGKNFTRVLFKGNASYAEALAILKELKNRSITDAFIVRYENGMRVEK